MLQVDPASPAASVEGGSWLGGRHFPSPFENPSGKFGPQDWNEGIGGAGKTRPAVGVTDFCWAMLPSSPSPKLHFGRFSPETGVAVQSAVPYAPSRAHRPLSAPGGGPAVTLAPAHCSCPSPAPGPADTLFTVSTGGHALRHVSQGPRLFQNCCWLILIFPSWRVAPHQQEESCPGRPAEGLGRGLEDSPTWSCGRQFSPGLRGHLCGPLSCYANRVGIIRQLLGILDLTAHLASVRGCLPGPHGPSERSERQPTTQ